MTTAPAEEEMAAAPAEAVEQPGAEAPAAVVGTNEIEAAAALDTRRRATSQGRETGAVDAPVEVSTEVPV